MKRCLIVSAIALSAALSATASLAAPVPADSNQGKFFVGINGGVAINSGDVGPGAGTPTGPVLHASDLNNTGFDIGVKGGYYMTNNVSLEEAFDYVRNSAKDSNSSDPKVHFNQYLWMTNVLYHFNAMSGFSPYLGFGIGLDHFTGVEDGNDTELYRNLFMFGGILGLDYNISSHMAVGVNYHLLSTASQGGTTGAPKDEDFKTPITNLINASVTYTF